MTATHALIPGRRVAVRVRRPVVHVARLLFDVLLIALIALVAGTVLLTRLSPVAGFESLVIRGGSMEPAIGLGSLVLVESEPPEIIAGDVIAFHAGQVVVTHRVVAVDEVDGSVQLQTRGDANAAADPQPVAADAVVGRVQVVVPVLGYLAWMIGTMLGLTALVCTVGTLLVSTWILEELEWHTARRVVGTPPPG